MVGGHAPASTAAATASLATVRVTCSGTRACQQLFDSSCSIRQLRAVRVGGENLPLARPS
jgi:hypothetical protein